MTISNLRNQLTEERKRRQNIQLRSQRSEVTGAVTAYAVADLPTDSTIRAGSIAYASDGRKPGETAGNGTGVLVYYDSSPAWISVHSGVAVTA